ncbi:MAG: secretin N-terminal domain-containing protein [Vulcanimicrobiaceae bacterium]
MRFGGLCLLAALMAGAPVVSFAGGTITLNVHDADVVDVVRLLGTQAGVNVVPDSSMRHERVTLHLKGVTFETAMIALARAYDLQTRREGQVLLVGSATSMNRRFGSGQSREALASRTTVFPVRNARAEDLVKPLTDALAAGTVVLAYRRTSAVIVTGSEPTLQRAKELIAALDADGGSASGRMTSVIPLRFVRASEALKLLKGFVPDGQVAADDRQNAILTTGTSEAIETVRTFVAEIDRPSRQVMFEVKVVDLMPQNDSSNVGIQFGGIDLLGQPAAGSTAFAFTRTTIQLNATVNFLVSKGSAKVLATPRLVTLNNHEASMLIGETYPIIYFDIRSGNQQIQTIDIGVKLRLTPTIGSDGSIVADLHPEYSEIQGFEQTYPIVASRKVDSTLRVRDGETIVLGGLLREIGAETVTKLPILGDLPILGTVFRNRQKTAERDEIVFLITPHILNAEEKEGS